MPSPIEITVPKLQRLVGTPDAPEIIDVRIQEDFTPDPCLIPGARRWPFENAEQLVPALIGQKVVVICHKGKKLSQGVAALLRSNGIAAEVLQGGHVAWRDAGAPLVPVAKIPANHRWVTRLRPKIDRIACPWLIRRFVDPKAQFLFVAPAEVTAVAEKFNATPFDVKDVAWSHRGANCTFDTMLDDFGLHTDPLDRMAKIIRAADTDCHQESPQAAGLLAISVGLSRQYKDDTEQLTAGMQIYDALYRWARDGFDESHDSQSGHGR